MRRWVVILAGLLVGVGGGIGMAAEAPPAGEPEASRVVARVNQAEITYGEFKRRLEGFQRERGPMATEQWRDILRGMVQEEILLQGAAAAGLDQDAAVKARLEQARRQVLIEELLKRKVLAVAQVTDEEARKMYEEN